GVSYSLDKLGRGAVAFALAAGLAAALAGLWAVVRGLGRDRRPPGYLAYGLLLACALAFWLPITTPARHFYFGVLALAGLIAGWLAVLRPRVAFTALFAILAGNVALAEAVHAPLVSLYPWTYPAAGGGRATAQIPVRSFLPNHRALEAQFRAERVEGKRLAAATAPEIVVFGDRQQYLLLGLLERGDLRSVSVEPLAGFESVRVRCEEQDYRLIGKIQHWPEDVLARYLERDPLPDARLYVQPLTVSRYDRVPVPADRELRLGARP
ncbi:MAG: hypothetical protein R3190_13385, partial [Thermoanaerobaculia bacterium]|nr:hypothetical protein [Thermoanaerobaculia bacterium]